MFIFVTLCEFYKIKFQTRSEFLIKTTVPKRQYSLTPNVKSISTFYQVHHDCVKDNKRWTLNRLISFPPQILAIFNTRRCVTFYKNGEIDAEALFLTIHLPLFSTRMEILVGKESLESEKEGHRDKRKK